MFFVSQGFKRATPFVSYDLIILHNRQCACDLMLGHGTKDAAVVNNLGSPGLPLQGRYFASASAQTTDLNLTSLHVLI